MKKWIIASFMVLCMCMQSVCPVFALDTQVTEDTIVQFGDEQVKQAIIDKGMDVNGDGDLTVAEAKVMGMPLNLSGMIITSLQGLEYTSIRGLTITEGTFSDVTPLESLEDIMEVHINNTNITDVPNFKNPEKIKTLDLEDNKIDDISLVANITNAISILLSNNKITDIGVLANHTKLLTLHLNNNQIIDITPLATCTNIYALYMNNNPISDITALSALDKLEQLDIGDTLIDNVVALDNLEELMALYIPNTAVTDLTPISLIQTLDISGTTIDIPQIVRFKGIRTLMLNHMNISDLTFLENFKSLESIYATDNKIKNIFPLVISEKLLVADIRNNNINVNDVDTQAMIQSLKNAGITTLISGQIASADSKPTVGVEDVLVTASMRASSQLVTAGQEVTLKFACTNQSDKVIEDFSFGIEVPSGITLVNSADQFVEAVSVLEPHDTLERTLRVKIGDNYSAGNILIKEKIVKNDKEYLIGGISLDVTVATIQGPIQMVPNEPFQVYGKVSPGSTVEICDFDPFNDRYIKLADAQVHGEWYTATISSLTKDTELVAKVSKNGQTANSNSWQITISDQITALSDATVYNNGWMDKNVLTGLPTFSATVNTKLEGRSFVVSAKFLNDAVVDSVTFHFADKTVQAQKNSAGYYTAVIPTWKASSNQKIYADVTYTSSSKKTQFIIGEVTVLIDPSGYVYVVDGETKQPVKGVQVVLEEKTGETDQDWTQWNANQYMQQNPQITDIQGKYGWDVPSGKYRLKLSKEGYVSQIVEKYIDSNGEETEITIPPVRTDVNIEMQKDPTAEPSGQAVMDVAAEAMIAITDIKNTDAVTESDLMNTVLDCITNENIKAEWTTPLTKTEPTYKEAGKITGIISLTDSKQADTAEVVVLLSIDALNSLADIQKDVDTAIAAMTMTNNTTAQNVMDAVQACFVGQENITAQWTNSFTKTNATEETKGSITGVILIKDSTTAKTVEVVINKVIERVGLVLKQTKQAVADMLAEIVGTNAMTKENLQTMVDEVVGEVNVTCTVNTFEVVPATKQSVGEITGEIGLVDISNLSDEIDFKILIPIINTDKFILENQKFMVEGGTDAVTSLQTGNLYSIANIKNNTDVDIDGAVQIVALYKNSEQGKVLEGISINTIPTIAKGATLSDVQTKPLTVQLAEGETIDDYELDYMIWDGWKTQSPCITTTFVLGK